MTRAALLFALAASPALAHGGHPHAVWTSRWSLEPWAVVPLLLSALIYGRGYVRLRARASARRPLARSARLFVSGWLVLAAAIVSPLHDAGERSFTAHMIEHELIMLPAALLLAVSRPLGVMIWAFPGSARRAMARLARGHTFASAWRALTRPVAATMLQALVLVVWHLPSLFDRALSNEGWHIAQHLSFLAAALIFWWAMAHGRLGRRRNGVAALCLFATATIGAGLGALMSLAASPWYARYAAMGMTPFGLTPQEDQQLAGLVMWVPGGMVHAGAALWLLARWLESGHGRVAGAR